MDENSVIVYISCWGKYKYFVLMYILRGFWSKKNQKYVNKGLKTLNSDKWILNGFVNY